jgi:hypothetical protein
MLNPLALTSVPVRLYAPLWCRARAWRGARRQDRTMKHSFDRPSWWAASAVPYRFFWLLPTAGAIVGFVASDRFGVPTFPAFVGGQVPALALEAWWLHKRPTS